MVDTVQNPVAAKRHILDIAARLFGQHGYAGVSLRSIAKEAGMQAASLYYHFASKDELVAIILNEGIASVHADVVSALRTVPEDDGRARLRAAVRAHLTALLRRSDYTSANIRIFGQVPQSVRAQNMATRQAYEALWDDLIGGLGQQRSPKARIRAGRLMVLGALNASLEWFDPKRGGIDALAAQYTDLFWQGFAQTFQAEGPS